MITAWDLRLALRAAALTALGALLIALIVATTDEGAPWPRRLGMIAALLPLAASLAVLATIRLAAARGELVALGALGVDPVRQVEGAVAGGALIGLAGPLLGALGGLDLGGLFPRPALAAAWQVEGAHLRELGQGLLVGPGGELARVPPGAPVETIVSGGVLAWTLLSIVLSAAAGPLWTGAPRLGKGRLAAGIGAVLLAVVAFQAVAARRLPAPLLLAGPLLLLIDAARARYLARRDA
ncbi:MAG: hypothetical protein U0359_15665 [Byssovorax sp.]